jgi:sterol 3beta-glucosyltransferase
MHIGIFTYGTRGDLQPYIALALGLMTKQHQVSIAATEDFKELVEGYGISWMPLYGHAENMMNSAEGQAILQTENSIKLMKYYFKVLHNNRQLLRKTYWEAAEKVNYIIANSMTLPVISAIAEKQEKKMALTYFMPPVVPTREFPLGDFDFLNFPCYNRFTYQLAQRMFWKFIKKDTNEYRQLLGLPPLKKNLITHLDQKKIPDLYCLSPSLIPQPKDWEPHHQITGFLTLPEQLHDTQETNRIPPELNDWLDQGTPPIYIGFGSNGVGNPQKISRIIYELLQSTQERILFCTGWSQLNELPPHPNLFVTKFTPHELIFPRCKVGIFHGGAGTLAAMLRHHLPPVIVSFYTDQPTWGKIIERKKLGVHIPIKKLTTSKLINAIEQVSTATIKNRVKTLGQEIAQEKGLEKTVEIIHAYFSAS